MAVAMKNPAHKEKLLQAVCYVIEKEDGLIDIFSLVKHLYLSDRKALEKWNTTITGDEYYCMKDGPNLSYLYDLYKELKEGQDNELSEFAEHLPKYFLNLTKKPDQDKLSPAEKSVIDDVNSEISHMGFRELWDYIHALPEVEDVPEGQRRHLPVDRILAEIKENPESSMRDLQEYRDTVALLEG